MNSRFLFTAAMTLTILINTLFAQDYLMRIANGAQINDNIFEFDIFIKSTGQNFLVDSYQCAFTFNENFKNGGSLTFSYEDGSSELFNDPSHAIGIYSLDGSDELSFASSMKGVDTISTVEKKVGHFIIQNSKSCNSVTPDITWNFSGIVSTIITKPVVIDFTDSSNHENLNSQSRLTDITNLKILPAEYQLYQNYPNPFNPSTIIKYSLPFESSVKISIYNLLGEFIELLVDKVEEAGNYSIAWEAANLAAGVYVYSIEAKNVNGVESFKGNKKMVLVK